MTLFLASEIACIAVCVAATVTDLKSRRIPNALTLPSIGVGIALNWGLATASHGLSGGLTSGLLPSLAGAALLFLSFLAFYSIRAVGMGDVKLMAAVGAFLMWPHVIWALAYTLFAGAFLGLLYAVKTRSATAVGRNMIEGARRLFERKRARPPLTLHHMPYALAITMGVMATVLHRYHGAF